MALPFVVQPRRQSVIERVGTETSGILEIERKGYLTTGEMAFVQQQASSDDSTEQLLALVQKVASKFKIDAQKAYEYVTAAATGRDEDNAVVRKISAAYPEELSTLVQALMVAAERKKMSAAFCILLYRVDSEYTFEEFMKLDPELVEALHEFFLKEEARITVDLEADAADKEEAGGAPVSPVEELKKK